MRHLQLNSYIRNYSYGQGASKASPSSQSRSQEALRRGLAEVDGLLAGFAYLDEAKGSGNGAQARVDPLHRAASSYAEELDIDLDDESELAPDSSETASDVDAHPHSHRAESGEGPTEQQWIALENIYDASDAYFRDFRETAKNLNCPRISALSKSFDNAKAMRDSAGAVFRDTLNGSTPVTLNDIFAFASLSYVISKRLVERKRLRDDEILAGIHVWRGSIQDEGDKKAFDKLAERLWPETKNYLHFQPLPPTTIRQLLHERTNQQLPVVEASALTLLPTEALENAGKASHGLPGDDITFQWHDPPGNLEWTQGLDDFSPYENPFQEYSAGFFEQTGEEFALSAFRSLHHPSQFPATDNPPPMTDQDKRKGRCPTQYQGPCGSHSYTTNREEFTTTGLGEPESQFELRNTGVFKAVACFCHDVHSLLFVLAGKGISLKDREQGHAREQDRRRFEETVFRDYFRPHRETVPSKHRTSFLGILSIAENFVKYGPLRSLTEVRSLLLTVAKHIVLDGDLESFCAWIYSNPVCRDSASPRPSPQSPRRSRKRGHSEVDGDPDAQRKRKPSFACEFDGCSKVFTDRANRRRHQRGDHEPDSIQCPICDFSKSRLDQVREHFRKKHRENALPAFLEPRATKRRQEAGQSVK